MKDWSDEKAELTVDVGSGWMSRYEFEGLETGSIIRAETEAGTGSVARVNGNFFAQAAVTATEAPSGSEAERWLCAAIGDLEETQDLRARPARGDSATELLPFCVRVGTVSLRMADLDGTGPLSLINLNRPFSSDEDAELIVAGKRAAVGKVVVIGENMGMRITGLFYTTAKSSFPRTTGSVLAAGYAAERVKDYDFRMPDRFTNRAIMKTREIHLEFLRGYQSRFPEFGSWKLALVDQLNYGEWLDDVRRPTGCVISFRPAERQREYRKEQICRLPDTFLIEDMNQTGRFSETQANAFREWAGTHLKNETALPFQIALDRKAAILAERDPGLEIALACLRNGWFRIADLRVGQAAGAGASVRGTEPLFPENRYGMILLTRFESDSGGALDIVYPEGLLDPYLPALGR